MLVLIHLLKLFALLVSYPNLVHVNRVHDHQVRQSIHRELHVHALFSFRVHHPRYNGETQQHLLHLHMHSVITLLKLDHLEVHHL